jgi:hypothetical protein
MKHSNMQQAFVGEDDRSSSNFSTEREGNEQIVLNVTGGTISLVVDGQVPDEEVFESFTHIQGEIALEGGKVLRFQVYGDSACTAMIVDAGEQTVVEPDLNSTQASIAFQ